MPLRFQQLNVLSVYCGTEGYVEGAACVHIAFVIHRWQTQTCISVVKARMERDAGLGLRCRIHHTLIRNLSQPAFLLHFQAISSLT
jgi:hypothetical protein